MSWNTTGAWGLTQCALVLINLTSEKDMADNKPTHRKHNPWHNYSLKCIYHITLVVRDRAAILGSLVEVREDDPSTVCPWVHLHPKGQEWYGKVWMNLTPLGMDVAECIHDIPKYGKLKGLNLKIDAQQVMDIIKSF